MPIKVVPVESEERRIAYPVPAVSVIWLEERRLPVEARRSIEELANELPLPSRRLLERILLLEEEIEKPDKRLLLRVLPVMLLLEETTR